MQVRGWQWVQTTSSTIRCQVEQGMGCVYMSIWGGPSDEVDRARVQSGVRVSIRVSVVWGEGIYQGVCLWGEVHQIRGIGVGL